MSCWRTLVRHTLCIFFGICRAPRRVLQKLIPLSCAAFRIDTVNHENNAPVLDTCFSPDGTTVFSVGGDKAVRMWQLGQQTTGAPTQIGQHDAPIKAVGFVKSTNTIVTGGWDRKLKFWDARQPNPAGVFDLPERVYAMDIRDSLLVVGTANRKILIYDCQGQPRQYEIKDSPLKYQTRCISIFTDATGFAVGSIEGRVGIHYVQKPQESKSFAFKCHRQDNRVYSVNAITFQNHFGTFATVGADGGVSQSQWLFCFDYAPYHKSLTH